MTSPLTLIRGFSMVEILSAIFITSISLFALAKMEFSIAKKSAALLHATYAAQQLKYMASRLTVSKSSASNSKLLLQWQQGNKERLPQAESGIFVQGESHFIYLSWGGETQKTCAQGNWLHDSCRKLEVAL